MSAPRSRLSGDPIPQRRPPGEQGNGRRDIWPRDFGRDGVSGMVGVDRAMRARDVSRPTADDENEAARVIEDLLARIDGRRSQRERS